MLFTQRTAGKLDQLFLDFIKFQCVDCFFVHIFPPTEMLLFTGLPVNSNMFSVFIIILWVFPLTS